MENDSVFRLRLLDAMELSTFYRNMVFSDSSLIVRNKISSTNNVIRHKIPDSRSLRRIAFFINETVEATSTMSWTLNVDDILLLLFWAERLCLDKLRFVCLSTLIVFFEVKGSHAFALCANSEEAHCCELPKTCVFAVSLHCYWNLFGERQNKYVLKLTILSRGRLFCEKCREWCWKNIERQNCEYLDKEHVQARIGNKGMSIGWDYSEDDYEDCRGPLLEYMEVSYDKPFKLTTTSRHTRSKDRSKVCHDCKDLVNFCGKHRNEDEIIKLKEVGEGETQINDLVEILSTTNAPRYVEVQGSCGIGKSTKVPVTITRRLV